MICLDLSPAIHQRAGIGRMAAELYWALMALDEPPDLLPFYNRAAEARADWLIPPKVPRLTSPMGDRSWRLRVLAAHRLRQPQDRFFVGDIDLFHGTDHLIPYFQHIKTVFTLHDLTPLTHGATHASLNRLYSRLMLPLFLRRADRIVTDSASTRHELLRLFPDVPQGRTSVNHLGIHPRFSPATDSGRLADVRRKYGLPERFFLFVGTIEARKNVTALIRAFAAIRPPGMWLVVAGKPGWGSRPVWQLLEKEEVRERVILPGFIAEEDLSTLYSLATAFVYPSLFEGFGFPVLEAMACGTPVICSAVSSLPEIAGQAAVYIDPHNQESLEEAMVALAADANLRGDLTARGLGQAANFTWERTARRTAILYQELLG